MYRYLLIFSGCLLAGFSLRAQQLKLGSNPTVIDKTALLELESSNQGLLLPRISDTNAFHPNPIPNGMLIYYVGASDSCLMIRKDGAWVKIVDFVNLSAHETDPIATAKTVSVKAGNPAISVTGGTQALGNNPSFTLSVPNTSPIWNADSLQSVKISATLPTANQFLNFDGSQWTPVSFDTGYVPNFSQKVRNLFSQGTGISYNATTGQISNTGVTSFSGGSTGLTPASPTTGSITLGGVLSVANGGTGNTSGQAQSVAGSHSTGYGLTGPSFNGSANVTWQADTSSANSLATKNFVRNYYSSGTGISVNNSTGQISNTGVLSVNGNTGAITIDTSYITNFYQKVRSELSAGTGINYNATTGVISSTDWHLTGNSGTTPGTNFLGTTDNQDLVFKTNNTEQMRITAAGNVGIGLNTPPETRLVVKDTLYIRNTSGGGTSKPSMLIFTNTSGNSGNGVFRIGGDGGDIFWQGGAGQCLQMGAYWPMIFMGNIQIPNGYFPNYVPGNTTWNGLNLARIGVAIIAQHNNDVPLVIRGFIGTSQTANLTEWYNNNGTRVAYVDNSGNFYGASFNNTSDKRLKTNLHPLTEVLSKIGEIHSYTFYYKQNIAGRQFPSTKQIGMIAQEVEKYFPELVSTDDQGYKALNYAQFTAVLLEAVKEQQAEIEKLQQENQQLKNELNIRISSLENKLKELLQSEVKNK
ncbi:endosialidase-like protein [Thermoflavifilum aggregans]|uniref:Endosialidase-like protein n=2 Tax=Thermoflavifilum aggregans TaxID=454188 RepID=A0A2M9CRP2_9BACT|nr:endosialidase-like protein [Thermoflavifilum aggregans]